MPKSLKITATPEAEDFFGKYEKSGILSRALIDGYFKQVELLTDKVYREHKVGRVLEIGCGPGYSTQRIAKLLPKLVQLEASEYVEHLVKAAKKRNPKIKIRQEDVYRLKAKDNSYDLIYLLEVLEHLDHPKEALAQIERVLKPGGFLIAGVPREPLWRVLNIARGAYLSRLGNTPGHLNHWSHSSLRSFLEKNFGTVYDIKKPLPWLIALSKAD